MIIQVTGMSYVVVKQTRRQRKPALTSYTGKCHSLLDSVFSPGLWLHNPEQAEGVDDANVTRKVSQILLAKGWAKSPPKYL